jgi:hypothetical protein
LLCQVPVARQGGIKAHPQGKCHAADIDVKMELIVNASLLEEGRREKELVSAD